MITSLVGIISLSKNNEERGIFEVSDKLGEQIVIRFIPYKDEHATIHRLKDGSLLKTFRSRNKPSSVWDTERVALARSIGYAKPEAHREYYVNSPFNQQGLFAYGEHIISRLFKYEDLSLKPKYHNASHVQNIDCDQFMLELYFSEKEIVKIYSVDCLIQLKTSLGWINIVKTPNPKPR